MKKNFLIITLFIIIYIILFSILIWQIHDLKSKNTTFSHKTEKLSTVQSSNTKDISVTNSTTEDTESSQDIRKKEIQDKIEKFGKNESGIPVLMYHFFYNGSLGEKGLDNNFLDISKFEEHLKYLKENEFFFPTFEELSQFINGEIELPKKSAILTIDDGNISFFALAIPIIEKYEIPVTSFIITSTSDSNTIQQYQSNYINFESHSHNLHQAGKNGKGLLVNLSYEKAYEDIEKSIDIVKSKEAFCYPFGHYNSTAKQVLGDIGYKVAFTTNGGKVKKGMDPLELPRVRILRDDTLSTFIAKVNN